MNSKETIAILVCKQISSNLKIKVTTNYSIENPMYIHLNICKQMINCKYNYSC